MFKRNRLLAVAAAVGVGALIALAPRPAAACDTFSLSLVERPLKDAIVDVGYPDQDSVGDLMIWANTLYDRDNASALGSDSGFCVRTTVGKTWECSLSVMLADGMITAAGTALDGENPVFAVTGGTGSYRHVSGEMAWLNNVDGGLNRFEFSLRRCP